MQKSKTVHSPTELSQRTKNRRRLLKSVIATGGVAAATELPRRWSQPVVDAVLLPSHAVLSGEVADTGDVANTEIVTVPCTVSGINAASTSQSVLNVGGGNIISETFTITTSGFITSATPTGTVTATASSVLTVPTRSDTTVLVIDLIFDSACPAA